MNNPWHHFRKTDSVILGSITERQNRWLMACLSNNQNSAYGMRYGFSTIASIEEFQRQVPIVEYETLVPWIDNIANGIDEQLFCTSVVAFEKTGGSHSGGKLIPYTAHGLADFRHGLIGWLNSVITQFELTEGKAYWALSPAATHTDTTNSGIPIGAGDALYLGEENLTMFAELSAVPLSLSMVKDMAHWQLLTLYFLIRCQDLRLISIWSPSFLSSLLTALHEKQHTLLMLLAQGGIVADHSLCADADALRRYQDYLAQNNTHILWPQLKVISCWADASSQPLARVLMNHFPNVALQPKGLLSTEAIITVPDTHDNPCLCIDSNFYEFIDDNGEVFLASEVRPNDEYRVIITTNSGLYRYQTGDRVKCINRQQNGVSLRFIGRSGVCSDLVGEKLTEPFVIHCLNKLEGFAALAPDTTRLGYVLLLDEQYRQQNQPWLSGVELQLHSNPQYAYARRLSQLHPLRYTFIEQPIERYLRWQYDKGKKLGDIKPPALLPHDSWRDIFQIQG